VSFLHFFNENFSWIRQRQYLKELNIFFTFCYSKNEKLRADTKSYFDTLEHNLNTAIYYSAVALNYLIGNQGCDCSGGQGEDGSMQRVKEPMGDRLDKTLTDENSIQLDLFDFMGAFGVVMTLAAISVVKKLNELAKINNIKDLEKLFSPFQL
jgi:hypothetical protein